MASLYELDAAILACVDAETGEVVDLDKLEALQMERDAKIENCALWVKELTAEAEAIGKEEDALARRRQVKEAKAERLRQYLASALGGEKFETAKVRIGYRKSTRVEITDQQRCLLYLHSAALKDCIRQKEPEIVKGEVAKLLKAGQEIPGAELTQKNNLTIK